MTTITVYDMDKERIEEISERYGMAETEIIEIIIDYIEDSDVKDDLFR